MRIEYRITLGDGQTFYLTVDVVKNVNRSEPYAHREAINDGFLLAAINARAAAWWKPGESEFNKVEFWKVHD